MTAECSSGCQAAALAAAAADAGQTPGNLDGIEDDTGVTRCGAWGSSGLMSAQSRFMLFSEANRTYHGEE